MAYQSQYSGAQIDAAVGKINAACSLMGAFYNKEYVVAAEEWTDATDATFALYQISLPITLPSIIQTPYVFMSWNTSGGFYDVPYTLNMDGTPQILTVYSNVRPSEATIYVQTGAGMIDVTQLTEVAE